MSDNATLKERVNQFYALKLPGQPMMMHMGTSYLVADLAARIAELEATLKPFAELGTGLAERLLLLNEVRAARAALSDPSGVA